MRGKARPYQPPEGAVPTAGGGVGAGVLTVLDGGLEQRLRVRGAEGIANEPSAPPQVVFPVVQPPEVVQLAEKRERGHGHHPS